MFFRASCSASASGFFDGIVLHQILQWHHMLTSYGPYPPTTIAGLEVNTLWDGLFHASILVEGVVDHQILGIHHVKADMPILDLAFLAVGALLLAGGLDLARRGEREAEGPTA